MRRHIVQILAVTLTIAMLWFCVGNVADNVAKQGIATGFGFLGSTAGFAIIQTLVPFSESSTYGRAFVVGLLNTLLVSVLAIILSTIFGFALGIVRLSSNWLVAKLAAIYIEVVRNVPLLLQIFFWYFVVLRSLPIPRESYSYFGAVFLNNRGLYLPTLAMASNGSLIFSILGIFGCLYFLDRNLLATGRQAYLRSGRRRKIFCGSLVLMIIFAVAMRGSPFVLTAPELHGFNFTGGFAVIPELAALLAGLTCYTTAFIAEIVRAGILGVSRGQKEAAYSLGMSSNLTMRLVVLPQALRIIAPPLTSQLLNVVKNSSLAAAIGYPDLVAVFAGTVLNQTGQAVEVIFITMMVYLTISLGISFLMNWYQGQGKWAKS